jgi:solute carrier family 25 S-adenosylmethionine transporter 26
VSTSSSDVWSAYYKGYWENILYAYPADVIKFVVYDQLKGLTSTTERTSPAQGALAGAVATAVAQLITTPLDVVRNRIMAEQKTESSSTSSNNHLSQQSYVDTLIDIGRKEGVAGLLAGASPRVGKAILSGAIQFATYEETKQDITNLLTKTWKP